MWRGNLCSGNKCVQCRDIVSYLFLHLVKACKQTLSHVVRFLTVLTLASIICLLIKGNYATGFFVSVDAKYYVYIIRSHLSKKFSSGVHFFITHFFFLIFCTTLSYTLNQLVQFYIFLSHVCQVDKKLLSCDRILTCCASA